MKFHVCVVGLGLVGSSVIACINDGSHTSHELFSLEMISEKLLSKESDFTKVDSSLKGPKNLHFDIGTHKTDEMKSEMEPGSGGSEISVGNDLHDLNLDEPVRDRAYWEDRLKTLEAKVKTRKPLFEELNSHAVANIFLGRYQMAIKSLRKQEKLYPNHYYTATNLGTVYELTGKLEQAKKWITAGIERNSDSHHGTEWLHLAILDAKIAAKRDKNWWQKRSILRDELDLENTASMYRAKKAILVQLNERLEFVSAPNKVVADLYYDLGRIYRKEGRDEIAEAAFKESLKFGDIRDSEINELHRATTP